jgi:hypothetical protein
MSKSNVPITQELVDAILQRAQDSSLGLEPPFPERYPTLRNFAPPHTHETLAMALVGGWDAKYDLISVMAAATAEIDYRAARYVRNE